MTKQTTIVVIGALRVNCADARNKFVSDAIYVFVSNTANAHSDPNLRTF